MKSIHIRHIDDETLTGLKRRAQRHRRSLQKEIETLLEDAARMVPNEDSGNSIANEIHFVNSGQVRAKGSREEIYGDDGR